MTEDELKKIERAIKSEDRPEDVWFVETIEELIAEIRELRQLGADD